MAAWPLSIFFPTLFMGFFSLEDDFDLLGGPEGSRSDDDMDMQDPDKDSKDEMHRAGADNKRDAQHQRDMSKER
jgi:hypothetical protein